MGDDPPRATLCSIPARVFARLRDVPCTVQIDDETQTVTFVDSTNGEQILRMAFGQAEELSEMAMVRNNSIEYTLPIDQWMVLDPGSLTTVNVPSKTAHQKPKAKKPIQTEDDVPFSSVTDRSPIASSADVSESNLLKAKITATLEFAHSLESQEDQLSALVELASFVLKETKDRLELESVVLALRAAKRSRRLDFLYRDLYCFSLKL
jgi:hypothetical protein